jgi:hypothetical protein
MQCTSIATIASNVHLWQASMQCTSIAIDIYKRQASMEERHIYNVYVYLCSAQQACRSVCATNSTWPLLSRTSRLPRSVCMYVCMCVCIYVYAVYMLHVCLSICTCSHARTHTHVYMCMCVRACVHVHMRVCAYAHTHMCPYIHSHTHTAAAG